MKLSNLAKYFDTIDTFDGYSGRYLFKSQPGSAKRSSVEGSIAKRRVLSTAPGITMPPRRAITLLTETWIVGDVNQDGLLNQILRQSFWMRKSTGLYYLRTPGQAVLASGGTAMYALREYLKETVNVQTDAEYDGQYEISFSPSENITKGYFIVGTNELYHIRNVRTDLAGFRVATSDDVTDTRVVAIFNNGAYDPVTDTYINTPVTTYALLFEFTKLYELKTQADPQFFAGDNIMVVAASEITPLVGQEFNIGIQPWKILTVTAYYDGWLLHVRRS